jgi:hypothetical protein
MQYEGAIHIGPVSVGSFGIQDDAVLTGKSRDESLS